MFSKQLNIQCKICRQLVTRQEKHGKLLCPTRGQAQRYIFELQSREKVVLMYLIAFSKNALVKWRQYGATAGPNHKTKHIQRGSELKLYVFVIRYVAKQ